MSNVKKVIYLFCLLLLLLFVSAFSVTLGSFPITVTEVYSILWQGLFQKPETTGEIIVWSLRLPRILMGIIAGISLGIAGSIMRGVLKNPLASPYTLGIVPGAVFGAVLAIILGVGVIPMEGWYYLLIGIAFVFAFIVSLFILHLASKEERAVKIAFAIVFGACFILMIGAFIWGIWLMGAGYALFPAFIFSLILLVLVTSLFIFGITRCKGPAAVNIGIAGIGLGMGWLLARFILLLLYFSEAEAVKKAVFWSIGGLGRVSWDNIVPASVMLVVCCIFLLIFLSILKLRDFDMISIGAGSSPFVKVTHSRTVLMAVAALLVASTVSFTGAIAFAGFVAPHIAHVTVGKENKFLLPVSGLLGALFLVGADAVARTIVAPVIIPTGVMTHLIGIPLFFYLLITIISRSKGDENR